MSFRCLVQTSLMSYSSRCVMLFTSANRSDVLSCDGRTMHIMTVSCDQINGHRSYFGANCGKNEWFKLALIVLGTEGVAGHNLPH